MVSIWKGDGKKSDKFEIKDINPEELEEKKTWPLTDKKDPPVNWEEKEKISWKNPAVKRMW